MNSKSEAALWITLVIFVTAALSAMNDADVQDICRSSNALSSCGQCIRAHPECSWCKDPNFAGSYRCDVGAILESEGCSKEHVYSPETGIEQPVNRPIGGHTQLQPQQIFIKMKPGESVSFSLKYLHLSAENRDAMILNSETESQGLQIKYTSECAGRFMDGRKCHGLKVNDKVTFNVTVMLKKCASTGDAVVSLGVFGVTGAVGLYVTPLCDCDCEKIEHHEPRSKHCGGWGNLICGSCVCIGERGGQKCDCPSDDSCRSLGSSDVCSGRGKCDCGECKCETDYFKGKFCECDITSCPIYNGIMCAGRGQCECGRCKCDENYSGEICDCEESIDKCHARDDDSGNMCNGNGVCKCNKCECSSGFDGELCDHSDYETSHADDQSTVQEEEGTTAPNVIPTEKTIAAVKLSNGCSIITTQSTYLIVTILICFLVRKLVAI